MRSSDLHTAVGIIRAVGLAMLVGGVALVFSGERYSLDGVALLCVGFVALVVRS